MMKTITVSVMIILLWASLCLAGIQVNGLERTVWAKHLSGGAIRVVFIGPYSAMQDAYELMQRIDIDGSVVAVSIAAKVNKFGIGGYYWHDLLKTKQQVLADVRRSLKGNWEAIMMNSQPAWLTYPEDIRKTILSAVVKGRVLFIPSIRPLQKDFDKMKLKPQKVKLQHRFPFDNPKAGAIEIYQLGKGFIVRWLIRNDARTGYILSSSELRSDFEYSAARAGWYLKLLTRPENINLLSKINVNEQNLVIITKKYKGISSCDLQIRINRWNDYSELFSAKQKVHLGERVIIKCPHLPSGKYIASVIAKNNKITLDWNAISFSNKGKVRIKAISIDKKFVAAGDKIRGKLIIDGNESAIDKMRLEWLDQWNRILLHQVKPFSTKFELKVPEGSLSVLNRLRVSLISSAGVEAIGSAGLLMPENVRKTDFYVAYWNTGVSNSWRSRLYYDILRRKGLADAFSNCGRSARTAYIAALSFLRTIPYATAFHGVVLGNQLFNEAWLAKTEQGARNTAKAQRGYNPLAYTLGDENYVNAFKKEGRFCDTPEVRKMFREYLHKVYPDIKSLNKQWGTHFAKWSDIRFKSEKEMIPSMNNPSAWVDYRMFITQRFANVYQRMRRAIQTQDPNAAVGWDGCEQFSSYDGYDWWQLTREMELTQVYYTYIKSGVHSDKIFNGQAVKSFGTDARISGGWLNGVDREYGGGYAPWYLLLTGWNSAWWWHSTFLHPANGACKWNLELTPIVADMANSVKEIKNGIASIIEHSKRVTDPIAVYYSENNWHASTIESGIGNHINNLGLKYEFWFANNLSDQLIGDDEMRRIWGKVKPKGHYAAASKNFYLLLHDLGFQPTTIARQQIEAKELIYPKTKVLVLPFVVSLSDREAEVIKSFVKSGGLLIADYRCGLRDLHGRMRKVGVLDDVFGIIRKDTQIVRKRSFVVVNNRWDKEGAKFPAVFHERIHKGRAYALGYNDDGVEAFFVNKYGKGRAIYFNCDVYSYDEMRRKSTESEFREYMRMLIRTYAGLLSDVIVRSDSGNRLGAIEVSRFRDSDNWYVGILPDFAIENRYSTTTSIRFPQKAYIYDVRTKHYFGFTDTVETTIKSGEPKLYACLPSKVQAITIKTFPQQLSRGKKITVDIEISSETRSSHSAILQIEYPDGSRPEFLHRVIYLPEGKGTFSFVPALNAPKGKWKIIATDCISGITSIAQITIRSVPMHKTYR